MTHSEQQGRYDLIKVILVGQLWINVPVVLLIIGLPLVVGFRIGEDRLLLLFLGIVLAFAAGVFLAWIWWGFLITYWRIWAFDRVHEDDWLRLRTLAKKTKLIWEEGGTYEKLERRNPRQTEQIRAIEERLAELEQVALIQLELTTPDQTAYRFNTRDVLPEVLTYLLLWFVIFGLLWTAQYILAVLLTVIVLFQGWPLKYLPHIFKKEAYLIIGDKGIETIYPQPQRYTWQEMEALAIQKEERKLLIRMFGQEAGTHEVLELRYYRIPDMDLFAQQLELFVQRYVEGRL
jgi:hypothetical protein